MNGFSAPSLSAPSMSMPSAPSLSGPFTDSQQEQMKREAQELLETFAKIYLRCYKSELVAKVKKDLRGPEESPYKLLQRPDGNKPVTVFTGLVTKRGAFIKNWKQRHFVIRSDGSCDYFASENDSKPKGSIVLEGYSVKESPSSDILSGKEHAFILEHYDEDKRVWYLHCESAESKAQAIQAFTQACRVATGYVNPDAIVRASFAKAHSALRRAYNLFQKTPRGTEKEALGEVVYERLYYTVVSDVVQPLTGVAKSTALKFVRGLISGIVAGAWKGMDEAVSKVRPTIEEGLKKALAPFVEAEDKIKSEIQEKVGEKLINPIVGKVVAPFFAQVVSILYPVVAHAFATQLEISIDVIGKHTGILTPENSQATFKDLNRALDISSATQQLPTKKIDTWISKVEQLLKVAGGLEDVAGVAGSIREVINETLKPAVHIVYPPLIEELMIRASKNTTYTFETLYKESKDATDAANSTHSRLEHDLKVFLKTIINRSLKEFVRKPFDKHIVQPAQDLIAPISESIPEDFKDFVDPESLLDDILEQTLDDAIEEAGGPGVSEMSLKLDGIMQQKGLNILS